MFWARALFNFTLTNNLNICLYYVETVFLKYADIEAEAYNKSLED